MTTETICQSFIPHTGISNFTGLEKIRCCPGIPNLTDSVSPVLVSPLHIHKDAKLNGNQPSTLITNHFGIYAVSSLSVRWNALRK
jgi:hypothetical protein